MLTFAAILRTLVGALSAFGLLYPVFLLLVWPFFFSPLLIAGVLYFALALLGVFVLPPRWQFLLGAIALHLGGSVLLWASCPPPQRALFFGSFAVYLLLWWSAVGLTAFEGASVRGLGMRSDERLLKSW